MRIRAIRRIGLVVGMGLAGNHAAQAIQVLDPALRATTFSTYPTRNVAVATPSSPSFPQFLYGLSRTPGSSGETRDFTQFDATGQLVANAPITLDYATLKFGAGAFANRLFALEYGVPAGVTDGVQEILPDGSVSLFSNIGGGNPDGHDIAFGTGGTFGSAMYFANPSGGTTNYLADSAIVRLDAAGAITGQLTSHPDGPFYLALGSGAFGDYLYFSLLYSNRILRADSSGAVSEFAVLDSAGSSWDVGFGLGGALGTDLYVSSVNTTGGGHKLFRVDASGGVTTVATGLVGFDFDFDPDSGDLFLADEFNGIVRIGAVPEPDTMLLMALGIGLLATRRSRRA